MIKQVACCTFYLLVTAFGLQNQDWMNSCATNPPDFSKLSYAEADKAASEEYNSIGIGQKKICPEYIPNLVNQLRNGQLNSDEKVLAVWLLGVLRPADTNSLAILIEYIDLKATKFDFKTRLPRWGDYPAEEALIGIGKPAVSPILQHLPSETKELRRHLMCEVLIRVEGRKGEVFNEAEGKVAAQNQIKQLIAAETDSTKRANLQAALKELQPQQ